MRAFLWNFHRVQLWTSNPPKGVSEVFVSYSTQCSAIDVVPVSTWARKGTHVGRLYFCILVSNLIYNSVLAPPCTIEDIPEIDAVVISVTMILSVLYFALAHVPLSSTTTMISM